MGMKNMLYKKIFICVLVLFCFFFIDTPVEAQEPVNDFQIFLPIVFREEVDTSSPWIGPSGGYVVCMTSHPSNPDIMYAGTWGGGVYMTVDGGTTWINKSDGLVNFYINSIAIDPYNPKILYAGTYQEKVFKTTNGGDSWYQSSNGIQTKAIVYAITIDPYNADIVYIGTRGENFTGSPPWKGIIYRSINEGIDWTPVLQNVTVNGVNTQDWAYDLIVNPKDHRIVFAAMHEAGIYRSTDTGSSWQKVNTDITTENGIISARGLSINPPNISADALYMGTWHRTGTFKSTNNAASWTNTPLDVKVYNMDLDNINPGTLYLANYAGGIYKTTNSAGSWSPVGLSGEIMYTVAINQLRHTQIFAGTVGNGIFRSNDSAAHWSHSEQGLFNTNVTGMLTVPWDTNRLYSATTHNGVSSSTDKGVTWTLMNSGLSDHKVNDLVINPLNNTQLIAISDAGGIFNCSLPNCTWTTRNSGLPTAISAKTIEDTILLDENQKLEISLMGDGFTSIPEPKLVTYKSLTALVFAPSDANIAYLATNGSGLYKSVNNTGSWTSAGLSGKTVNSVVVHPLNSATIYAATNDNGVVKFSTNSGVNWQDTTIAGGITHSLAVSPMDPEKVYAATDNGIYVRVGTGTWTAIGLGGIPISVIAAHPTRPGVLVAGADKGIYYSLNYGVDWITGPVDLMYSKVRSIRFDLNYSKKVFLGTTSNGTYRIYLP
jgi:photosystem II stability/assembly factor-like uncharacterized protein